MCLMSLYCTIKSNLTSAGNYIFADVVQLPCMLQWSCLQGVLVRLNTFQQTETQNRKPGVTVPPYMTRPRVISVSRVNEWLQLVAHPPRQVFRNPLDIVFRIDVGDLLLQDATAHALIHLGIAAISVGDEEGAITFKVALPQDISIYVDEGHPPYPPSSAPLPLSSVSGLIAPPNLLLNWTIAPGRVSETLIWQLFI